MPCDSDIVVQRSSARIGCGQMPKTSVATVSVATQSLLMAGSVTGVVLVANKHSVFVRKFGGPCE